MVANTINNGIMTILDSETNDLILWFVVSSEPKISFNAKNNMSVLTAIILHVCTVVVVMVVVVVAVTVDIIISPSFSF